MRLVAAALHLAHEEDPESDEEQDRCPADEDGEQRVLLRQLGEDLDLGGDQSVGELGVGTEGQLDLEFFVLGVLSARLEDAR